MELGAVSPTDVGWIADAIDRWDCTVRWALGGGPAPPALLHHLLWDSVVAQRSLREPDGAPAGLLQVVNADLRNGVAELAMILDPERGDDVVGPLDELLARSFRELPLRKIMASVPADAASIETSLRSFGPVLARLGAHQRRTAVDYVDVLLFEVRSGSMR